MNNPGTRAGNWTWRLPAGLPTEPTRLALAELTRATGRMPTPTRGTALTNR
jgi:4-alpha-glucanotransferase